jgi:hypothetical protein
MRTPHNAEGHLLSLEGRWMALPFEGAEGADIGASESLLLPRMLARLRGPNRTPLMAVRWFSPAKRRCFGDGSQDPRASRARHPAAGADPTGRRRLISSG